MFSSSGDPMAVRILIISDNPCTTPYPVFPLGAAYIVAALNNAGHEARLLDCSIPATNLAREIGSFGPRYIGLSIRNIDDCQMVNTRFFAPEISAAIDRIRAATSAPLILGGGGFSLFPRQLLELTGAKCGIVGEGESAIVKLIDALDSRKSCATIPGLVYRDETGIRINPPATLGHIGQPERPAELAAWYIRESSMLNIQTQRGCAFRCCYCSYPVIEGRSLRQRDPDEIADEIVKIKSLGAPYFFITDSVFNTTADHVAGTCEAIIRRDLKIEFGCFLSPQGLTGELMRLLFRAGLRHIEFGADSLSDPVLQEYGKDFFFDDIRQSSDLAFDEGIRYAHFLIIGGPGETEGTINQSFENSKHLKKTVFFPFVGMRIYPRTALYDCAIEEKIIRREQDIFTPAFYLSPAITRQRVFSHLNEIKTKSRNWIIGEPPPQMQQLMGNLRKKGIAGPLWEFLAA